MRKKNFSILVIVPAYNEEKSIKRVINDLQRNFPEGNILVVNDGSHDNTSVIAKSLGITVIDLPYNLGIGGAMQTGFLYALNKEYDAAIQFDGDGQHKAEEINKILQPFLMNDIDLVVASRFHPDSYFTSSIPRIVGGKILSILVSVIIRSNIRDTTSGFRVYSRNALEFFSDNYPIDFPEVESLVLAHKRGLKISEVSAHFLPRIDGKSSINSLTACYYMIKVILAVFVDILKKIEKRN